MDREFDWNETIEAPANEDEFLILPEGTYKFTVKSWERSRHNGSPKLPPCNAAIVHIEFDGGTLGKVTVNHKLFLHSKTQGLLCNFFRGCGLRKSGEPLVLNWDATIGKTGQAKLGSRKHEGKTYQDIKTFLDPEKSMSKDPVQPAMNGTF